MKPLTTLNKIILCADDYAQNEAISMGILQLATKKRINAISCLVNTPLWPELSRELIGLKPTTSIGLHFNLTFGEPLSAEWRQHDGPQFGSLAALLIKSHSRQLNNAAVNAEIHAQLDAFTKATGRFPDFIDGHQHIHQLPIIRDCWLQLYRDKQCTSFFRNTCNGWRDLLSLCGAPKPQLILLLGGMVFKHRLKQASIPTNTSFAGIYNFKKALNYRDYFKLFLKHSADGGLIMCHPGLQSTDLTDPLYQYRHHEFTYLMSEQYLKDLVDHDFEIGIP